MQKMKMHNLMSYIGKRFWSSYCSPIINDCGQNIADSELLSQHVDAYPSSHIPFLSSILALCSDVDVYYSSHHLTELGFLSLCTFPLKSSALVHIKSLWVKGLRESPFTILALCTYTQSFPNVVYKYNAHTFTF